MKDGIPLSAVLEIVAGVRRDYPLQGDACDRIARALIALEVPASRRDLTAAWRQAYREMWEE